MDFFLSELLSQVETYREMLDKLDDLTEFIKSGHVETSNWVAGDWMKYLRAMRMIMLFSSNLFDDHKYQQLVQGPGAYFENGIIKHITGDNTVSIKLDADQIEHRLELFEKYGGIGRNKQGDFHSIVEANTTFIKELKQFLDWSERNVKAICELYEDVSMALEMLKLIQSYWLYFLADLYRVTFDEKPPAKSEIVNS